MAALDFDSSQAIHPNLSVHSQKKIAHFTVHHHLSHLSVDIQSGGLIKFREDSSVQM